MQLVDWKSAAPEIHRFDEIDTHTHISKQLMTIHMLMNSSALMHILFFFTLVFDSTQAVDRTVAKQCAEADGVALPRNVVRGADVYLVLTNTTRKQRRRSPLGSPSTVLITALTVCNSRVERQVRRGEAR